MQSEPTLTLNSVLASFTVLAIAGFFFAVAAVSAHDGHEETYHIYITETGYEPNTITIEVGDTIVFENRSDTPRWPASNNHPTHTLYPGSDIAKCGTEEAGGIFDACRGLELGESYAFTFNEVGSWRFHDHLAPRLGGVITVAPHGTQDAGPADETGWWAGLGDRIARTFGRILEFFRIGG